MSALPVASRAAPSESDDLAACRDALRDGSRTFLAASWLLPRPVRDSACALYAFCRVADDTVDHADDERAAVARMRGRLDRIYRGRAAPTPADRAMARIVERHALPRALPEALIDGFAWDAEGRRYETVEDLHAYGARVAGSVGAMMAVLMGVRSAPALARACDLGVAMQLSNIARDVGEDARMGRLYLPRAWMREAGLDPDAWLAAPRFDARLATVVRRLLREADRLYRRVDAGIGLLPPACRPGINAARVLYAAIGHEVERRGADSVSQRAVVSSTRKARLLAVAFAGAARARPSAGPHEAPLAAVRFLVEAACPPQRVDVAAPVHDRVPARALGDRVAWVIELFERQAERQHHRRGATLQS